MSKLELNIVLEDDNAIEGLKIYAKKHKWELNTAAAKLVESAMQFMWESGEIKESKEPEG